MVRARAGVRACALAARPDRRQPPAHRSLASPPWPPLPVRAWETRALARCWAGTSSSSRSTRSSSCRSSSCAVSVGWGAWAASGRPGLEWHRQAGRPAGRQGCGQCWRRGTRGAPATRRIQARPLHRLRTRAPATPSHAAPAGARLLRRQAAVRQGEGPVPLGRQEGPRLVRQVRARVRGVLLGCRRGGRSRRLRGPPAWPHAHAPRRACPPSPPARHATPRAAWTAAACSARAAAGMPTQRRPASAHPASMPMPMRSHLQCQDYCAWKGGSGAVYAGVQVKFLFFRELRAGATAPSRTNGRNEAGWGGLHGGACMRLAGPPPRAPPRPAALAATRRRQDLDLQPVLVPRPQVHVTRAQHPASSSAGRARARGRRRRCGQPGTAPRRGAPGAAVPILRSRKHPGALLCTPPDGYIAGYRALPARQRTAGCSRCPAGAWPAGPTVAGAGEGGLGGRCAASRGRRGVMIGGHNGNIYIVWHQSTDGSTSGQNT